MVDVLVRPMRCAGVLCYVADSKSQVKLCGEIGNDALRLSKDVC